METFFAFFLFSCVVFSFKSYYVVWKPIRIISSYASSGFKSYYVVWKHDMITDKSVPNFLRLNRTM